ncbi:hypothetical protein L798_11495 [Zootermopsis nevadensis]|uniref:Uncharacterized protein n=1 Tax=Zootermopsis nevadensis TaxID=136037 RepID=A0A067QX10_ZOONE|nr:hypothetical protein L798_11495 [Zootermopsis nevadensis]
MRSDHSIPAAGLIISSLLQTDQLLRRKMHGKQLKSRTVRAESETSRNSDLETEIEMPCGQLECFNEASSSEVGNSVLRTEDEPENSAVEAREGTENTGNLQQANMFCKNTAT